MDEAQVQHDEEIEYESASVSPLVAIAEVLGVRFKTEIVLPSHAVRAA